MDWEKYFPFKTNARRKFGLAIILQHFFIRRAWLNISRSQKPSPPSKLWHTQLSTTFYQNQAIKRLQSTTNILGSLKQPIIYVGIACVTALIMTSHPSEERKWSFHLWRTCQIWSLTKAKVLCFPLCNFTSKPKYFTWCSTSITYKKWWTSFFTWEEVLRLKLECWLRKIKFLACNNL